MEKNLSEQGREPTTNSTHIWRRRQDSNPGHIGGRRVLSPLRHPCSNPYTVYRWPLRHLKEEPEVIPILRSLLTNNPPRQGKVGHTTRVYVQYSFRTMVWVLLRPTRTTSAVRLVLWFFVLIREDPRYPDLGSDTSSVWNFCARFRRHLTGNPVVAGVTNCKQFSLASILPV